VQQAAAEMRGAGQGAAPETAGAQQ
jgi:hypothetical protein